jgi:hypothetical protein
MLTFINKKYIVAPLTIQSNDPVFEIDRISAAELLKKGAPLAQNQAPK